jgi:hypothetical protein
MHILIESFLEAQRLNELRQEQGTLKKASDEPLMGCVMGEFNIENWEEVTNTVEPADLYVDLADPVRFGVEEYAHITICDGLVDGEFPVGKLLDYLGTNAKFTAALTGISLFSNKDYDVVKFDVVSEDLVRIHEHIMAAFPTRQRFPDFHPHLTLAYVKAGHGQRYVRTFNKELTLELTKFCYSDPNRKKYKVKPYDPAK